ncbi:hypothetical protein N7449_006313, partial [Penicillium cf. viridicatum]
DSIRVGYDEETVTTLIENPQGAGWNDLSLQKALLRKLRRNYTPAVYDDLLGKIDAANTILRTLIDKANRQERRARQTPWTRVLKRYQRERKHTESVLQTIGGTPWRCHCREHHCVHLRLQPCILMPGKDSS